MNRAEQLFWTYADDDGGVTAIEYGLIASILSVAILIAMTQIGLNLQLIFNDAASY